MRGDGPFLDWTARARTVTLEDELGRRGIKLPRRSGAELIGPCPKCGGDDRFSINPQKRIFNCRGCGVGGDVIRLVEHLDGVDFKTACETLAGPQPKPNGKAHHGATEIVAAEFQYHDESGKTLLVVERVEFQKLGGDFILKDGKRDKAFRQKRPDPDKPGRFIPNADGVPLVPYKLPQLLEAAASNRPILIVEGEAKAELLWSWNVAATCSVGGAKKWKPAHSEYLRGADVFLLPDNDNAGWEHANKVGASLSATAKSIRVVTLPGLLLKGDVIDWAKAGGTREKLDALLAEAPIWRLPTAEDQATSAKAREDELLNALMKAPPGLEFHRKRDEVAKELQVPKAALEAELQKRREAVPLHGHWKVVPSAEPVDGDALLRDIFRRIRRHIACSSDDALAMALWVMFSWVHDEVAVHSPILLITSAEGECGKSTTLALLGFLAPRALLTVDISRAALYRSIQLWQPSFIIDEFDTVLSSQEGNNAELRSVINSGHTRGQCVIRCITDDQRPEPFSTFAPKVLGMVGRKMPATTLSRCLIIELRRCPRDERIDPFQHEDDDGLRDLRRRLRRWSMDNADALKAGAPMPEQFGRRQSDNWRVLLAIADLCSGAEEWGDKARAAAIKLEGDSDKQSIGVQLLADIKRIFDDEKCDAIFSSALVTRLKEDQEGPWAGWNHGHGLSQHSLAMLLGGGGGRGRGSRGGFGIRSVDVHIGDTHSKGYRRSQFEEAWSRYVAEEPSSPEGGE